MFFVQVEAIRKLSTESLFTGKLNTLKKLSVGSNIKRVGEAQDLTTVS